MLSHIIVYLNFRSDRRYFILVVNIFGGNVAALLRRYQSLTNFGVIVLYVTELMTEIEICNCATNFDPICWLMLLNFGLFSNLLRRNSLYFHLFISKYIYPLLINFFAQLYLQFVHFYIVNLIHQLVQWIVLRLEMEKARLQTSRVVRWN